MSSVADSAPARRYRRRIVGLGVLLAAVVAAVGAPFYLRAIERDLERRVPERLASVGVSGVSASFSGQDGTIHCPAPLADPQAAIDVAYEVTGVRTVELDRSCRVSSAPEVGAPATAADTPTGPTTPSPGTTAPSDAEGTATTTSAGRASTTAPAFNTVGEIVRTSPRFSILSSLVSEAELGALLDGSDPITLFAPDNDAIDELTADVLAELRTEPDLLAEVLRHHIVDGVLLVDDLVAGELATMHGDHDLVVTRSGAAATVDDATVVDGDLLAANGVVHVVDRMMLPDGLELRALDGLPEFVAIVRTGQLDLSGPVADDDTQAALLAAAATSIDPVNVTHDMVVDPDGLGGASAGAVGELVAVAPVLLTSGAVGYDGTTVFVRGTYVDDAGLATLTDLATQVGATVDVVPRPVADDEMAAELTDEMNAVVAASPLEFAPGSAELTPGTAATLDVLAALAKQAAGVHVVVEGHTDSDGSADSNLALSDHRAEVVLVQLVARGVPREQLGHRGVGDSVPVLVDGVEDKAASRRVEFAVTARA